MPKRNAKPAAAPNYLPTVSVRLDHSFYGTPQPTIVVIAGRHSSWRGFKAFLHQVAAAVELASAGYPKDGWLVEIAYGREQNEAYVYLELIEADEAEVARGMQTLRNALAGMGA